MIRVRRPFLLTGPILPSKSWLNRALILRSLYPDIQILEWEPSELDGEDVTNLARALKRLESGENIFDIGESGTGLRFLIARLSLEKGSFVIRCSRRLLERPHAALFDALASLGTTVSKKDATTLAIEARGWPSKALVVEIDVRESSQFASALLLAATRTDFGFELKMNGVVRSSGYLEMTRDMISSVQAGRRRFVAETDASSVATLAILAVAASQEVYRKARLRLVSPSIELEEKELSARLENLEALVSKTKQPDRAIFEILKRIRTPGKIPGAIRPIDVDLSGMPDVFPCLAALAVFGKKPDADAIAISEANAETSLETKSRFVGAPHLRLKESDRIAGIARLLKTCGIAHTEFPDGIEVVALTVAQEKEFAIRRHKGIAFKFDPENDHRLAFAAAVLAAGGIPIDVSDRGVVAKSFPMFWSFIEGDAPRVALIGQRGAGKTEAARRWGLALGARATVIDLDREIERLAGKSAQEIFAQSGETEFRWFEQQAWREVDNETRNSVGATIVAVGAGFDPSIIDDSWRRVWLRRATDRDGRVFTDRPRLDPSLDALSESRTRAEARAPGFNAVCDRVLELGEGALDPIEMPWVADFFDQEIGFHEAIAGRGGFVTLMPNENVVETCERLLRWGVQRIEIRDDLWPPSRNIPVWDYLTTLPQDRILISFRDPKERSVALARVRTWPAAAMGCLRVDVPVGASTVVPIEIIDSARIRKIELIGSVHATCAQVTPQSLIEIETKFKDIPGFVLKAALETVDFKQLRVFHDWMMESSRTRTFLPMTPVAAKGARWAWYRAHFGVKTPIAFWREGDGSSADQPTLSQWWRRLHSSSKNFAAVLGDPVRHSRTPLEHEEFFRKLAMPVYAVQMARDEVAIGLPLLLEMGMKAAAVTAPLKEEIADGRALNTFAIATSGMVTANTDNVGFERLLNEANETAQRMKLDMSTTGKGIVVWGGGGVLSSIAPTMPDAVFFSASMGRPRDGQGPSQNAEFMPDIVIWAAGQQRGQWPPNWKPRLIIDLSYTENSMGRVIALETGARYVSGLSMFEAQAAAQREFWKVNLNMSGANQ